MKLHHIAYVTENVEEKARSLCAMFGFRKTVGPIVDEKQGVRVIFLEMGGGAKLELLEPLGLDSPIQRHLKKGGGLYHLCFEVDNLDETLERVVTTDGDLVEFVETDKQ